MTRWHQLNCSMWSCFVFFFCSPTHDRRLNNGLETQPTTILNLIWNQIVFSISKHRASVSILWPGSAVSSRVFGSDRERYLAAYKRDQGRWCSRNRARPPQTSLETIAVGSSLAQVRHNLILNCSPLLVWKSWPCAFFFTFIHSCLFSFQALAQPGWLTMHALSQQHPASYSQFNTFTPAVFRRWTAVWGWVCRSWASPWHVSTFKIFLNPLVLPQGYRLVSFPSPPSPETSQIQVTVITVASKKINTFLLLFQEFVIIGWVKVHPHRDTNIWQSGVIEARRIHLQ